MSAFVNKITANVRYSKNIGQGEYKTVELGAEATVGPDSDWYIEHCVLYNSLVKELKELWNYKKEKDIVLEDTWPTNSSKEEVPTKPIASSNGNESHSTICPIHNVPFERKDGFGKAWYSHMVSKGVWCKAEEI